MPVCWQKGATLPLLLPTKDGLITVTQKTYNENYYMKTFQELNLPPSEGACFIGEKIQVKRIIDREIAVMDYRIEPSKKFAGTMMLAMQVKVDDNLHVIFTSGKQLIDVIEKVQKPQLPFRTTIVKVNERSYKFT